MSTTAQNPVVSAYSKILIDQTTIKNECDGMIDKITNHLDELSKISDKQLLIAQGLEKINEKYKMIAVEQSKIKNLMK